MKKSIFLKSGLLILIVISCKQMPIEQSAAIVTPEKATSLHPKKPISKAFKNYWYAGNAEITSYQLEQARYGEMRKGKAVLIYVTEPFHHKKQVKADGISENNIPVLKLNTTKNYLTGIYPYSIMSSSFYGVHNNQHALKLAFSSQEWCGQVYAQLNNSEKFDISSHSYFESEGDQQLHLEKSNLENEIWNQLRIDPKSLPTGTIDMIPSLEYIRLSHKTLKAYKATATVSVNDTISSYSIEYPELERSLTINYHSNFPFAIESWSERFKSGYGTKAKIMTSTAVKIKTIKTPYWEKNNNSYLPLRDSLGL